MGILDSPMIGQVKRLFGKEPAARRTEGEAEAQGNIPVAVCALLLEMSSIDGEFSPSEQESIISLLKEHYGLSDAHAAELMAASRRALERSIDLWQFTNLINKNYSREEKIGIIEMTWQVLYADEKLDKHEDYLAHKLAKLLRLTHKELIDAKLKARKSPLLTACGR